MTRVRDISVIITLLLVSTLCIYVILLVKSLQAELPKVDDALVSVRNVESATVATEGETAGAVDDLDTLVEHEESQQNQQLAAIQGIADRGNALLEDADKAIISTGTIAPQVTTSLASLTADLHTTLQTSQGTMQAATNDLSSPELKDTMVKVQESAQNTADSTKTLSHTMTTVDQTVTKEAHDLTAPPRKIVAVTLFVARLVGKLLDLP